MAAKGARESITLACSDCKRRNYTTEKNKILSILQKTYNT